MTVMKFFRPDVAGAIDPNAATDLDTSFAEPCPVAPGDLIVFPDAPQLAYPVKRRVLWVQRNGRPQWAVHLEPPVEI